LTQTQPQIQSTQVTYYGQPLLKKPVWIPAIPIYFFVGGSAGVAMTLGMVLQFSGEERLARRCHWAGAIGGGVGSALLISDLGRKLRFLNMLRVLRPTSPMSIGSWVLALATPASLGSAIFNSRILTLASGILGMPLATYTAVLIANTAIPVWYRTRHTLPFLFAASSVSGMASVFDLISLPKHEDAIIHRIGVIGRSADLIAGVAVEKSSPDIAGPLWRAATVLTGASLVVSLLPGRSRAKRAVAGVLGIFGSVCVRFAVTQAGKSREARLPQA
jgi:formate-dependent nitrite reductase membrane component NrfD